MNNSAFSSHVDPGSPTVPGATRAIRACALLAALLGILALIGWITGARSLAALGPGLSPMSPSTAMLLVLYGTTIWLTAARAISRLPPRPRRLPGLAVAPMALGSTVAALLLALSVLGITAHAEHPGIAVAHAEIDPALGHMSPVTAGCFVLAALAFLTLVLSRARDWRARLALACAVLLLATSGAVTVAYLLGGSLLYPSATAMPALSSALALLAIGTGLVVAGWTRLSSDPGGTEWSEGPSLSLIAGILCGVGILVSAYAYFQRYEEAFRRDATDRLAGIAELKVNDIAHWRQERLGDAGVFFGNRHCAGLAERALRAPADVDAVDALREWLGNVRTAYDYESISLLAPDGTARLTVAEGTAPPGEHLARYADRALEERRVLFLDFHRDPPHDHVHLETLVPILGPGRPPRRIGVLAMRIDPRRFLFPLLQRWPIRSASAETILLRREGDTVVFLNELRFREAPALSLRVPLDEADVPAVMAVRGLEGVVEEVDYRGVPAVAVVKSIPDSPWSLVARIDRDEIYAPLRADMWRTVGVVSALLLGLVAAVGAAWQRRAKKHYRAVAEQERRYRSLFESMALGVVYHDTDGAITSANPAAERILGRSLQQLQALPLTASAWGAVREDGSPFPADEHPAIVALRTAEPVEDVTIGVHNPRLDETRWILIDARPEFRSGESTPFRVLATFADITARKRTEEHRNRLQAQLGQSQKMESVGRLAGGVAHDFNNMLSVILGNAEMAMGQLHTEHPAYDDLRNIREAAERSAELTRQLLAFARKQTVAPEVLNLNQAVESTLRMLRRLIGEEIELVWQPAVGLWPVEVDPSQVDQLLANVIVNARDAIDGIGEIVIETANVSFDRPFCEQHVGAMPGDYVQLSVSDDGAGMDEETLEHAFDPFFTTKSGHGTGLGLSTVYGIVKQNAGFVYLDSETGRGTKVKIYLPRAPGTTDEDAAPERVAEASGRGAGTILLVEDEAPLLQLTARILEHLGYTVLAADAPGEALRLAREHEGDVDLLLTDVVMPEMDGRELAERLGQDRPDMEVVYMSGYPADVLARRGTLDKGVHLIQKPFSMQSLAVTIRQLLD